MVAKSPKRRSHKVKRTPHWRLRKDYVLVKPLARLKKKRNYISTQVEEAIPSITTTIQSSPHDEVLLTTKSHDFTKSTKETDEVAIAIVDASDEHSRTVVVDGKSMQVEFQGSSQSALHYTVVDEEKNAKPESFVINIEDGTVETADGVSVLVGVGQQDKVTEITITIPVKKKKKKKKGSFKEKAKTGIIIGLVAILLSMWGKPAEVCKVVTVPLETSNVEIKQQIPLPHHFFLPELNPLGINGPLTLANFQILQTMENVVTDVIKTGADQAVRNANYAFRMGGVVENSRNTAYINALRKEILQMRKTLDVTLSESKSISRDNHHLREEISDRSSFIENILLDLSQSYSQIADLQKNEDHLYNLLQGVYQSESEALRINKELQRIISDKEDIIRNVKIEYKDLYLELENVRKAFRGIQTSYDEATEYIAGLIQFKIDLEVKVANLEASNTVSREHIEDLQKEIIKVTGIVDTLKHEMQHSINFHHQEISRLESEKHQYGKIQYQSGYEASTANWEKQINDLQQTHTDILKSLKKSNELLQHEEYVRGRKEVSEAIGGQVATLQQKLTAARKNMDTFYKWAAPHIRVIRLPDGKYEVNHNAENISKISPLMKDYIADVAEQFEKDLNGQSSSHGPPAIVDLKITQRIYTGNGLVGKLKDALIGPKMKEAARFQMLLVGTSDAGVNDKAPMQYYEYMPIDLNDFVQYKEIMEKAASVSVTTVTTTMTNVKTDTVATTVPPVTVPPVTKTSTVTLPPELSTITITESVQPVTYTVISTPSPFTETVTEKAIVTETPSQVTVTATETSTYVSTEQATPTSVFITKEGPTVTVTRTETVKETETATNTVTSERTVIETTTATSTALVTETATSTSISVTTQTVTITPSDPELPSMSIHKPAPTNIQDVVNIENETNIFVGENSEGTINVVKTETTERASCSGGMVGTVINCVMDYTTRLSILKELRIKNAQPPLWATPRERDYVSHKAYHPFIDHEDVYFNMVEKDEHWTRIQSYFYDDSIKTPLQDMIKDPKQENIFNTATFFRAMQLQDLFSKRKKIEGWWSTSYEETPEWKQWMEENKQADPTYVWEAPMGDWWSSSPYYGKEPYTPNMQQKPGTFQHNPYGVPQDYGKTNQPQGQPAYSGSYYKV